MNEQDLYELGRLLENVSDAEFACGEFNLDSASKGDEYHSLCIKADLARKAVVVFVETLVARQKGTP